MTTTASNLESEQLPDPTGAPQGELSKLKGQSPTRLAVGRFRRDKLSMIAFVVVVLYVGAAIAAPFLVKFGVLDPNTFHQDLTDPSTAERVVERAVSWAGGLDVVVWNGGGPTAGRASELKPEDLQAALELLYLPAVRLIRAAMPHLVASTSGRVLAITASGVKEPIPAIARSNSIRPGLAGYLKSLAGDLAPDGVTVNCIAPGRILTDRARALFPEGPSAEQVDDIPMGRFGSPEDVGSLAAFLASDRASYLTGTTINVDGGLAKAIF